MFAKCSKWSLRKFCRGECTSIFTSSISRASIADVVRRSASTRRRPFCNVAASSLLGHKWVALRVKNDHRVLIIIVRGIRAILWLVLEKCTFKGHDAVVLKSQMVIRLPNESSSVVSSRRVKRPGIVSRNLWQISEELGVEHPDYRGVNLVILQVVFLCSDPDLRLELGFDFFLARLSLQQDMILGLPKFGREGENVTKTWREEPENKIMRGRADNSCRQRRPLRKHSRPFAGNGRKKESAENT